jgi:uncharacterized protein YjbI with pentapeptide repeats
VPLAAATRRVVSVLVGLAALVAVTPAVASAASSSSSILVNGDFSQPAQGAGNWGNVGGSIPGWTATNSCGIEVWGPGFIVGEPFGAQALELASNCVSGVQQTVSDTPGQKYLVSYYFAARPGTSQSENAIQASWNGTPEQSESSDNPTPQPYSFTVTGTGSDTLKFADTNPNSGDGAGTVLSLVSMQPVQAGSQLQWPAPDATGTTGSVLSTSGKFDDTNGDPLTLTADNTVGTFTDNGDGSWSWSYTPSQANAATPITVTASDGKGSTATDTFNYTTKPQGVTTPCVPSGPWDGTATLALVGMTPGDVESAYVTDAGGNFVDYFDDLNYWAYGGPGVDANGNETLTADGYSSDVLQPGTSVSVNVYNDVGYDRFNATYSVPVCGLVVPSSPVTATTSDPNGAPVSFSVSDLDAADGTDPVSCSDPAGPVSSGDVFPVGSTTVSCSSTDSTGATTSASFVVQVTGPPASVTVNSDSSVERGAAMPFTGQVTDSAGDPVSGATVRLSGAGIDSAQATGSTDADGSFNIQAAPVTLGTDTVTAFVDAAGSGRQDPGDPSATTQVRVIQPPASAFTSCAQVQAQDPLAGDGDYFIDFGNSAPVPVYCSGMLGADPQPYLTLQNTGPSSNYFQNTWQGGTTYYTRVHLVPSGSTVGSQTCESVACIDTSDTTFANSGGYSPLNYGNLSTCGWAQANGNIDLTGTPFAVAPNAFTIGGWGWWGAAQYSANGQVVNLSVGGDCGGANPTTDPILPLTLLPQPQSIAFPSTGVVYGQADFSPASSSSGLPVSYADPSGACTLDSDGLVQITGAGNCTVTASQGGGQYFQPAAPVTQTFAVAKAPLTVDANAASTTYGQPPALSATLHGFVNSDTSSTAGISGTAACQVVSGTSTDVGTYPGAITCGPGSLQAQNYSLLSGSGATLTITPASQTISFPATRATLGQGDVSPASASSGLPVSYSSSTPSVCAPSANSQAVHLLSSGTCTVTASQSGDNDYQAATAVTNSFTVGIPPAITSAAATSFTAGSPGKLSVVASGYPSPSITEAGALPNGVTLTDNGNGTATLAGTPAHGTGGVYPITIAASNGFKPDASQSFMLTVSAPTTTSLTASPDPANTRQTVTYTATVSAAPTANAGTVTFTDNGATVSNCSAVPVSGGQAICQLSYSATGNHTIGASFNPGGIWLGSTATSIGEMVSNCGSSLQGCSLQGGDLAGANLAGQNLSGDNLTGTDLQGANLQGAALPGTNLKTTNLQGANLAGANVAGSNLMGANLAGADLAGTNLSGGNLKGDSLKGANLTNANLKNDNLQGADLSGANLHGAITSGANLQGITWSNTVCPDGTNSDHDGGTCTGDL